MMAKNLVMSILAILFISTIAGGANSPVFRQEDSSGGDSNEAQLLTDGFLLTGVDGKLTSPDGNEAPPSDHCDRWFFEFDSDVSDGRGRVRAGTSLELLPSAALQKITANIKKHSNPSCRLWGRVTKYRDKNFIFPVYFLPLAKIKQPQLPTSQKSKHQQTNLVINEPDDALAIPKEIVAKLESRRVIRRQQLQKGLELKQDFILADRTGFISSVGARRSALEKEATQYDVFVLDALGQGIQQRSFQLLPCGALQQAQMTCAGQPEPIRFKITGIVTKYKNTHYLLLQRAIRAYSYGNFSG